MSALSFILALLTRLPAALNATTRLVRAAKPTEPQGDPEAPTGAEQYLRGRNEARLEQKMYERIPNVTQRLQEKEEPEEPTS